MLRVIVWGWKPLEGSRGLKVGAQLGKAGYCASRAGKREQSLMHDAYSISRRHKISNLKHAFTVGVGNLGIQFIIFNVQRI